MRRLVTLVSLAGFLWLCAAGDAWAASGKRQTKSSALSPSGISKTLREVRVGTRKFVRGAVDLVTLKPLREKKTATLDPPSKPWLNNSSKKKKEEKKSLWSSLFSSKEKPKRVETMKDFIGLERPR